jgi:predicted Ser/Thr protein kinase
MVPCPICQHPNPAGATVCQSCGSPLGASASVATPSLALPKGTTLLNGRYVIERDLGQGGFGITYKATDTLLSRPVAIKEFFLLGQCVRQGKNVVPVPTVKPQDYQDFRREFIEEARVLAKIEHQNKVKVHDVFEENNTAYMVMEFVEGKNLLDLLNERGGVMDEKEAIDYITQVAGALEAMHKAGYLHRDIKPQNIMVTRDGRAVLIDFGAAKQFIAQKTETMEPILTPGYAPLEQYSRRARFGPPLDIYALGATLYHLLTGQVPPAAPDRAQGVHLVPPHQLNPKVSRQVSDAVMKAMEIEVAKRYQSVGEFVKALQASAGAPSVIQPPVHPPTPPPPPPVHPPTPPPPPPVHNLRYLGRRVGERMGAVTGALSGAIGGLGLGIAAGLLLIAGGAIIGAIAGGIAGAVGGAQAAGSSENGCAAMAGGLIGGAILGYFVGILIGVVLAVGASIGALAVGGYRGMEFGMRFGSDLSERYGVVPTSLILSAVTGFVIGLVWSGFVLYVQPAGWVEVGAFITFVTVIGAMIGSVIGSLGFWFLIRQQGWQMPFSERVTALASFPVGLLLSWLMISLIPYPQRWWDVASLWGLWREKLEGQIRENLGSQPSRVWSPPSPRPSPEVKIRYVQVSQANVRSGPGTQFSVIRVVRKGAMVRVIGISADGGWAKVMLGDGTIGYISRKLLGTSPPR